MTIHPDVDRGRFGSTRSGRYFVASFVPYADAGLKAVAAAPICGQQIGQLAAYEAQSRKN